MNDIPDRLARIVNGLLNRYLVRGADGAERPIPYNPIDYQTLRFVAAQPDARATDIADHIGVAPTTMQSVLDRLVRRDLLIKRRSASDGRARCYALTEKGQVVFAAIEAQDRANMAEILQAFTAEEQLQLVTLLERVVR